jgi:hypothetical protein
MRPRPALQHPGVGVTLALAAIAWLVGVPALYLLALQASFERAGGSPASVVLLVACLVLALAIPIVGATAAALLRWRYVALAFGLMVAVALVFELAYATLLWQALHAGR